MKLPMLTLNEIARFDSTKGIHYIVMILKERKYQHYIRVSMWWGNPFIPVN